MILADEKARLKKTAATSGGCLALSKVTRIALPPKNNRLIYLPMMDWRIHCEARLIWLVEALRYVACYEWKSISSARYWIASQLREAHLEPNESPWPPPFDFHHVAVSLGGATLGCYGISWRGDSDLNRCRQRWWARKRDHAKWVEFQIAWLEDVFKGLGDRIERAANNGVSGARWQITLNEMLDTFEVESKKCGCVVTEENIELRSGVELGLYE